MNRLREAGVAWGVALVVTLMLPSGGHAAAEVRRLSLVVSGIPGSFEGGGLLDTLHAYNLQHPGKRGIVGLEDPDFGWHFDAELRYFVRPNVALSVGAGQVRVEREREVLPRLQQLIQFRTELLSVPAHAGVDYYLAPYVQGDFQARAFVGGGVLSLVYNKVILQQTEAGTDSSTTLGDEKTPPENYKSTFSNDAPGYYLQAGVQMWFPARLSVLMSAYFRSAVIRDLQEHATSNPMLFRGEPVDVDLSGVGARFALAIGL